MAKLLLINCVCGIRSTGRICSQIAREYDGKGYDVRIAYGRMDEVDKESSRWAVKIGGRLSRNIHAVLTRLFDLHGTGPCSYFATKRFLKWAEEWNPDVIWLHNIHGYYLNYRLLFDWIKRHPDKEVKWTLHDCWTFTGHCAYFTAVGCNKWSAGCKGCPRKRDYPASVWLSRAKTNWESKRSAFVGVKKMTLITPSKWLADLTRKSFLKEYPVQVVANTIDTTVFRPTQSDFRERMNLTGRIIILGVASSWDVRKGLSDFIELRGIIGQQFAIVLIGLTGKQLSRLPEGIIGVSRTNSASELAAIYTAADWLFNPTHEDNYPTVNLEARACGCKIATYDTGGAAETVEGYDKAWVLSGKDKTPTGFVKLLRTVGHEGMKDE